LEIITIELTKRQIEQLQPLQDEISKMYDAGKPGAIAAQVNPINGTFMCRVYTNAQVVRLHKAWKEVK